MVLLLRASLRLGWVHPGHQNDQGKKNEEGLIVTSKAFSPEQRSPHPGPRTHLCHLLVLHAQDVFHQVVGLADELHVSVLYPVVYHLHKVSCPLVPNLLEPQAPRGLQGARKYTREVHIQFFGKTPSPYKKVTNTNKYLQYFQKKNHHITTQHKLQSSTMLL